MKTHFRCHFAMLLYACLPKFVAADGGEESCFVCCKIPTKAKDIPVAKQTGMKLCVNLVTDVMQR